MDEALELRNINHEKLSQATGIPERYIWAIQNINIEKLPAAPYVRGYIKKISEMLQLNHDELWELYKKELEHKRSGAYDKLPSNRFAIKHISKSTALLTLLAILLIIYTLFSLDRLIGEPNLIVASPENSLIATSENPLQITGKLEQKDKLTINGEEVFIGPDGAFSKEYDLQPGLNVIEFKAKRLLGREVTITKRVLYEPQPESAETANTEPETN